MRRRSGQLEQPSESRQMATKLAFGRLGGGEVERLDLHDLLEPIRRELCTWMGDHWVCRCGAELSSEDAVMCDPCARASAERAELEARAHRARAHWARVEQLARRALMGAPDWDHARIGGDVFRNLHPKMQAFGRRYSRSVGSVAIFGPSGCGKTTAVLAALRRLGDEAIAAERRRRSPDPSPELSWLAGAMWTSGHALAKARKQHRLGEGEAPLIVEAMEATLLTIDEVGYEPVCEAFFEVVDARYTQRLPTIVTSGLTSAAFRERYGDACYRRLTDKGIGAVIEVEEPKNGN